MTKLTIILPVLAFSALAGGSNAHAESEFPRDVVRANFGGLDLRIPGTFFGDAFPDVQDEQSETPPPRHEDRFQRKSPLRQFVERLKGLASLEGTLYEPHAGGWYPGSISFAGRLSYPDTELRLETCPYGTCLTLSLSVNATTDPDELFFKGMWMRVKIPLN